MAEDTQQPQPEPLDIPEEAVEAVLSREGRKNGYMTPEFVRADLKVAALAIRRQAIDAFEHRLVNGDFPERLGAAIRKREQERIGVEIQELIAARSKAEDERNEARKQEQDRLRERALQVLTGEQDAAGEPSGWAEELVLAIFGEGDDV